MVWYGMVWEGEALYSKVEYGSWVASMGCGEWGTVGAVFRSGAPGHRRGVLAITATRVGGTIWYGNVWNIWYGMVRYGTVWYGMVR